jgi:predicted phosphate transport protein (TIGR00153 family)
MMRLLPRQEEFFDLFIEVATRSHEAAEHLLELFTGLEDRREYHVDVIKRLEHEADEMTHEVVRRLDRTFITPIDREDIHLLASDLDDVVDRIDSTARRAQIFRLGATPEGIAELCEVIVQITAETAKAVEKLRGKDDVIAHCIEAKRLEEEGDAVYHTMLGRLFERETDPIAIIKWKEMYDNLERTIDDCEDVANDLESIVLKNA